jgi:basic membrane protein A
MIAGSRTSTFLLVMCLVLAVLASGCAPAATPAPVEPTQPPAQPTSPPATAAMAEPTQPPPSATPEPFKIALIVEGELADGSWNQFEYDSIQQIEAMPEYELSYSENVGIPDFARVAADYCRQNYDMIIAHTFDFQEPALEVAPNCPNTKFVVQGGWKFADNVAGMGIWPNEGGYLAGVLGGLMTKTNKLGLIGGFAYAPTQVSIHEAFKLGVKSVNPDATVVETWTGTWFDVGIGYEAANAMIDDGVDFITISLSGPGLGAIDAAKDHNAKGGNKVYAVGAFVDMNSRAPDTVITSGLWLAKEPTLKIIKLIQDGQFEGKSYDFFMADGASDIAPYHSLDSEIPQEVKDKVAEVRQQIIDGTLKVPLIKESPSGG